MRPLGSSDSDLASIPTYSAVLHDIESSSEDVARNSVQELLNHNNLLPENELRELICSAAHFGRTTIIQIFLNQGQISLAHRVDALYLAINMGRLPMVQMLMNNAIPQTEKHRMIQIASLLNHSNIAVFIQNYSAEECALE